MLIHLKKSKDPKTDGKGVLDAVKKQAKGRNMPNKRRLPDSDIAVEDNNDGPPSKKGRAKKHKFSVQEGISNEANIKI